MKVTADKKATKALGTIQEGVKTHTPTSINRGISCPCWECFCPVSHLSKVE